MHLHFIGLIGAQQIDRQAFSFSPVEPSVIIARVTDKPHGVGSRLAEVENLRQVEDVFDEVLSRRLKAGGFRSPVCGVIVEPHVSA